MEIPPTECFDKVLCASDDENPDVKKTMYNWWRAFFDVFGKVSDGKIPKVRVSEYNEKIDDLMAEIMKAGDKESSGDNEVVLEDYEEADKAEEDEMNKDFDFAIQHIGEIANKVKDIVNFVNPYCETKEVYDTMKKTTNERGGSDWVSMDDIVGMEVGESDDGDAFWKAMDDADDLDDDWEEGHPKFRVGDLVSWRDPEYPDELSEGWRVETAPEDDGVYDPDAIYVIVNDETGSEAEVLEDELVPSGEIKPSDADVDVTPDMYKDVYKESGKMSINLTSAEESDFESCIADYIIMAEEKYGSETDMVVNYAADRALRWIEMILAKDCTKLNPEDVIINWADDSGVEDEFAPAKGNSKSVYDFVKDIYEGNSEYNESKRVNEANDALPAEEFLDRMLEDAEDTDDVFEVYDGGCDEDGYVFLNVRVNKEDTDSEEVEAEFRDAAAKYGWEYSSWAYSSDIQDIENTVGIVVYFKPIGSMVKEGDVENELKKGDDGWREIGQPVGEANEFITPEMKEKVKTYVMQVWMAGQGNDRDRMAGKDIYQLCKFLVNNGIKVSYGGVQDDDSIKINGEKVGEVVRSYSSRKVNGEYRELKPKIQWFDDGMVNEAKATVWCVVFSDGTEKKFKCSKDEAKTKAKELAEKEGLEVKKVYPVLYPRNPYKGIFKETTDIVDSERPVTLEGSIKMTPEQRQVVDNAKKTAKKDGYDQYIILDKEDGSWSFARKHTQDKSEFDKFNQEVVGIVTSDDLQYKPCSLDESDEQKPDEVKGGEKKFKKDGETKTLVTGSDKEINNNQEVTEMTIEQEITDPWKLLELLWGQGRENLRELLESELFDDEFVMQMIEDMEIHDLTSLNDAFAFDFETILDMFGCDPHAWSQNLEIKKKGDDDSEEEEED